MTRRIGLARIAENLMMASFMITMIGSKGSDTSVRDAQNLELLIVFRGLDCFCHHGPDKGSKLFIVFRLSFTHLSSDSNKLSW